MKTLGLNVGDTLLRHILASGGHPYWVREAALFSISQEWDAGKPFPKCVSLPFACRHCKAWGAHSLFFISDESICIACVSCKTLSQYVIPSDTHIRGSYRKHQGNDQAVSLHELQKRFAVSYAEFHSRIKFKQFTQVPKGYGNPNDHLYPSMCFALDQLSSFDEPDSARALMVAQKLLGSAPMLWVAKALWQAASQTDLPDELEHEKFLWNYGCFFLPPNSLKTPKGNPVTFVGFFFADEGYHKVFHNEDWYYAPSRRLLAWTMTGQTLETYTAEMPLAGELSRKIYHPEDSPGDQAHDTFIRQILRLILVLNLTATRYQEIFKGNPIHRERSAKNKHRLKPLENITATIFDLKHVPEQHASPRKASTRKPYWAPGWSQRYRCGKGRKETIVHWRPPQYVGASNE